MFESVGGANYLALDIARFVPPRDVTLAIEVSGDLAAWLPATGITNTPARLKARDTVPLGSAPKRFIRLKAIR